MKTTQKEIKQLTQTAGVIDVTHWKDADLYGLRKGEGGLNEIAWSRGTYGRNGGIWQGVITGTLYAVTSRSNALFILM